MSGDFFLGFVGHAHTKNDLEADPNKSIQLRKENSAIEARRLVQMVLDKIENDISSAGRDLEDVKLLVLYLSYRGETDEKDRLISESVLKAIEEKFKGKTSREQLRLVGHTTAGEIENEDLELKEVSGIGYNGMSLLALVTNLPIGIGRTWGLGTEEEAAEHGKEMVHDAWVDFGESTESKQHLQKSKTLLVLTKGPAIGKMGCEYFLTTGISDFVGSTREARIANVLGGCSGDGIIGQKMHQFYGKIGRQSELKVLDNDAVCALIPNIVEPSFGLDVSPVKRIGKSYVFHFDPDAEPKFKYLKRIGDKDPREVHAKIIYENETQIARERGLPELSETEYFKQISEIDGIPLNLTLAKYAFAFPFGNYAPASLLRVHRQTVELLQPIRSHDPSIPGYVVVVDHERVQKGTRNVFNMLRENRGFKERDTTLIVTCVSRRLAEMIAGCSSNTESQIFKEALSSTQVMGFLAYGELSFTHFLQEPYVYNFSCWGITLRSVGDRKGKTAQKVVSKAEPSARPSRTSQDRVPTGCASLDSLLYGGIPKGFAVALTAPSCDERESIVNRFLKTGAKNSEITFHLTVDPRRAQSLARSPQAGFYLFVCNPQADAIIESSASIFKLKGVENLTDISIAVTSAIRKLDASLKDPRRACIEIVSDVLLQHHAVQTRRWLNGLIPELRSKGFTTLAVIDPEMHSPEELHAILGLFDGEINVFEKENKKDGTKFLRIDRMSNQKHVETELAMLK